MASDYDLPGVHHHFDAPPKYRARIIGREQADEIHRRYQDGEAASVLALEFGVSTRTIRHYGGLRRGY